jgi:hypothetical protein
MARRAFRSGTSDWLDIAIPIGICAGIVVLLLAGWIISSSCEASAYRRLTGKQVTTYDAMFLDLRVQEGVAIEE